MDAEEKRGQQRDWITGSYKLDENQGEDAITLTSRARLEFRGAPTGAAVIVRVEKNQGLAIHAAESGRDFQLAVELESGARVDLDVDVNTVSVVRDPSSQPTSLTIASSLDRLVLHGDNWRVDKKREGKVDDVEVVAAPDSTSPPDVQLSGSLPLRRLRANSSVQLQMPVGSGFEADIDGDLSVFGDLPARSWVRAAGKLTVRKRVCGPVSILASEVSAAAISSGESRSRLEVAGSVTVRGACSGAEIVSSETVQAKSLSESYVRCTKRLQEAKSLSRVFVMESANSNVIRVEGEHPIAVLIGHPAELHRTPGYGLSEFTQAVDSPDDVQVPAPGGWGIQHSYAVTDSTIEVVGPGLVLLPDVSATELQVDGQIQVDGELDLTRAVRATSIWCRSTTIAGAVDLPEGSLVVTNDVHLAHPLRVGQLVVGGTLTMSPFEGDEEQSVGPLLSADIAWIAGPLPSGFQAKTTKRLVARLPNEVGPCLAVAGLATLEGGTANVTICNHGTGTAEATDFGDIAPPQSVTEIETVGSHLDLTVKSGTACMVAAPEGSNAEFRLTGSVSGELIVARLLPSVALRLSRGKKPGGNRLVLRCSPKRDDNMKETEPVVRLTVNPGAAVRLKNPTKESASTFRLGSGERLELAADVPTGVVASLATYGDEADEVVLRGVGTLRLRGKILKLSAHADRTAPRFPPRLSLVGAGTAVEEAIGSLRVAQPFEGRLHGPWRVRQGELRILRVASPEAVTVEDQRVGHLIDVDVTALPFDQVSLLAGFEVIEPTARSLRALARGRTPRSNPTERAELRSRSEKVTRLLGIIDSQAVAGSSRAAAKWSAARLHHRSLPKWSREWVMRLPHFWVGYSQNPLWAGVTLMGAVALAVALRVVGWLFKGTPFGLLEVARAARTAFIQPFTLVRFSEGTEALFWNPLFNLFVFALVAVPFLYFVIALRNYLRTPGE